MLCLMWFGIRRQTGLQLSRRLDLGRLLLQSSVVTAMGNSCGAVSVLAINQPITVGKQAVNHCPIIYTARCYSNLFNLSCRLNPARSTKSSNFPL